jgi:hypothetical protein
MAHWPEGMGGAPSQRSGEGGNVAGKKREILVYGGPLDGATFHEPVEGTIFKIEISDEDGTTQTAVYEWIEVPARGPCKVSYLGMEGKK